MDEMTRNVDEYLDYRPEPTGKPFRPKLAELGQMITNRIGVKVTQDDPEYWGLDAIMTDEMVDIALKMQVRKPKTLPQLVKLTGMDEKHLEEVLQEMAVIGIIEYNW